MKTKAAFPPGYLPTLDGWRAVSILAVIFYHGSASMRRAYGQAVEWLAPALHLGWIGVCIFFGISGLLITRRLLEEQSVRGQIDLKKFYIRRAFRILPPILVLLIVYSVMAEWFHLPVSWTDRLRALLFASNYGPGPDWFLAHTWSLSLEEHFYLFWPLTLVALGWFRAIVFALVASTVVGFWRIADIHYAIVPTWVGFSSWRTDANVDYLLLGAVAGCLLSRPGTSGRLEKIVTPKLTLFLAASLIASIALVERYPHLEHPSRCYVAIVIPLILAGTVLHPFEMFGPVLEWAWVRWLGRLSYSLYLWQQLFFVGDGGRVNALGRLQDWPINFVAALVCAAASFYLVEKPCIRLGHRLASPVNEGRSDLAVA